jgi:hypothetical protein
MTWVSTAYGRVSGREAGGFHVFGFGPLGEFDFHLEPDLDGAGVHVLADLHQVEDELVSAG